MAKSLTDLRKRKKAEGIRRIIARDKVTDTGKGWIV